MVQSLSSDQKLILLRYPGGKQRQLAKFAIYLPSKEAIQCRFIEPFLGGGAVFFHINPMKAFLSDINRELIDLYTGISNDPLGVWQEYVRFPSTRKGYYRIRNGNLKKFDLTMRAARTLYLNRTCFKGMWRHNASGDFNVGYGGQDRRWVISEDDLVAVADRLQKAELSCCDFEAVIDKAEEGDFIFLDPPYRPGQRELQHQHYEHGKFRFKDQVRLADALERATSRKVKWMLTNSSHPEINKLYREYIIEPLRMGTGSKIGQITSSSGEALIRNYEEI